MHQAGLGRAKENIQAVGLRIEIDAGGQLTVLFRKCLARILTPIAIMTTGQSQSQNPPRIKSRRLSNIKSPINKSKIPRNTHSSRKVGASTYNTGVQPSIAGPGHITVV